MRITVVGGCGAWPSAGQACSGYLVEHDGFRLLLDPGYAVAPGLDPGSLDAVFVSHGHPDHCADLNPLLRGRVLGGRRLPTLPVYAPPGAVDRVLALDSPTLSAAACAVHDVGPGTTTQIGPFTATTVALPHHVPNLGVRLRAGRVSLAYTGDTGPSPAIVALADGVDLFLAEATYPETVPEPDAAYLSSAAQAGAYARDAVPGHLVLTHLWPGTDPDRSRAAAAASFTGPVTVAVPGLVVDL